MQEVRHPVQAAAYRSYQRPFLTSFTMIFKSLLVGIFLQAGTALFAQSPRSGALQMRQVNAYGEEVAQVSFDGDATPTGIFRITDSHGAVVLLTPEAELIHSPYYFSVGLETLKKDEQYVFSIETPKQVYTTPFKLQ
jgi:hypothetical protein